jgi:hypothetical protein
MPTYGDVITGTLQGMLDRFLSFLPSLVVAIVILIVGSVIASLLAQLIRKVIQMLHVDELANNLGLDKLSSKVGRSLTISGLLAWIVKWFLLIATFLAAVDILGLKAVVTFLNNVLLYVPNVLAAAAFLLVGVLAANFLGALVKHALRAAGGASELGGAVTQWAIMVFTILAVLFQLRIAPALIQTLFTGVVAMLAIAGGIAFGLGGRDAAKDAIEKLRRDISSR